MLIQPAHRGFPAIVHLKEEDIPDNYNAYITGDIYETSDVDLLRSLDSYEGYPHLYRKAHAFYQGVRVTYYYMPLTVEDIRDTEVIVSQDWRDREQVATLDEYLEAVETVPQPVYSADVIRSRMRFNANTNRVEFG